jgi:hypothetical protein
MGCRMIVRARRTVIGLAAGLFVMAIPVPAGAQETREQQLAVEQADKATRLHPYVPTTLERRIETLGKMIDPRRTFRSWAVCSRVDYLPSVLNTAADTATPACSVFMRPCLSRTTRRRMPG